jgi:heme exporter protein CcmD
MAWWEFNGYGFYVWGSYLVAAAAIAIESALLATRRKQALRRVDEADADESHAPPRSPAPAGLSGSAK